MGELRSMTGLGLARGEVGGRELEVTVQGVNHRHLDLVVRLPDELRPFEPELRRRLATCAQRGRCELSLRWGRGATSTTVRRVDREGLLRFLAETRDLVDEGSVGAELSLGDLARSPFLSADSAGAEPGEEDREAVEALIEIALAAFDASRRREGEVLEGALRAGLVELRGRVEALETLRGDALGEAERRLRERLDAILPGGADGLSPERLAQEVVLLVDRLDVREEIDRLDGHLAELERTLDGDGPHGRRLDFLLQEILRELNTVGSKSRDLGVTGQVVEAKVLHERLREQAQNVE